jgi:nucleoside-diphosphate-sugar epimerase
VARILITGVHGCIGAWVASNLLRGGHQPIGADLSAETHRLRLLGVEGAFPVFRVDICDGATLDDLLRRERVDAVIHLAALQIPLCRANPARCVEVNVGGTMRMLEQARARGFPLIYASSVAVYGPDRGRPLGEDEGLGPQTLYGAFKRANEEMAAVYHREYGVRSVGFRPHTVYGPGRDVGVTSDITVALAHAARGDAFRIRFGGTIALQHASDVARAFVAAALRPGDGARVYNLRGTVTPVADAARAIETAAGAPGLITCDENPLPIAGDLSDARFQADFGPFAYVSLDEGLAQTLRVWRAAGATGVRLPA